MKKMMVVFFLFLLIGLFSNAMASGSFASREAYFDVATGYTYIKNSDTTYTEYSKKGKLVRSNVPNTLPLLVKGKYVRQVTKDCYYLYERRLNNKTGRLILPANQGHPQNGWSCEKMLFTAR